jgi:hypothetical protein
MIMHMYGYIYVYIYVYRGRKFAIQQIKTFVTLDYHHNASVCHDLKKFCAEHICFPWNDKMDEERVEMIVKILGNNNDER